jgi:hypothetical protein
MKKSFNIQEFLHRKSKRHKTKPMHPSSLRTFQRDQECDLKHPNSMDLISTKQNKTKQTNNLVSYIDDWPIRNKDKLDHIHYTIFYKVLSFVMPSTSLSKLCKIVGQKPFS